jgi:hypothetical protein
MLPAIRILCGGSGGFTLIAPLNRVLDRMLKQKWSVYSTTLFSYQFFIRLQIIATTLMEFGFASSDSESQSQKYIAYPRSSEPL